MRLHVFRIHQERSLQSLHRVAIAALQEQNAANLVCGHTVTRVLLLGPLQTLQCALVIAGSLADHAQEEMPARQCGLKGERLFHEGARRFRLAFLNQRASHVQPPIGIAGLRLGHVPKCVLRAFEVALQQ